MDGYESSKGVFVMGATNLEDSLDPAILWAGRFDKIIKVPLPNKEGRELILWHYLSKVKSDMSKINLKKFVMLSTGMSGSELKNLVNLAAIKAVWSN